jgi:hypothetical protein
MERVLKKPEDTSKRKPIEQLAGACAMGASGYVEDMEARGQKELVASDVMPAQILHSTAEELVALGFTLGPIDTADSLFRPVILPTGWKRIGSSHAMWSYIVDERGIRRVAMFYKAAFYDRRAHVTLLNPGREIASLAIYGEEPEGGIPWTAFTRDELSAFKASTIEYIESAKRCPSIYADREPRAKELLARVEQEEAARGNVL